MAAAVAKPYTTGQMGMWGGTTDGQPGVVDYKTKENNINPPAEIPITVEDYRYAEPKPTHKTHGYEMIRFPTAVADEHLINFKDEASKKVIEDVYAAECVKLVKELSGATTVIPFDWQTRLQNKKVENAVEARTGEGGLPIAHVDRDTTSAPQRLKYIVGEEEGERLIKSHGRWAAINVWRPVGKAVEKWPLCMVNTQDVPNWKYDTHMARVISRNDPDAWFKGQKPHDTVLKNHENLRYHYCSDQKPEEAWVFSAFDSRDSTVVPHGAFWDDNSANDASPRLSFELRTWCFFDEIEESA